MFIAGSFALAGMHEAIAGQYVWTALAFCASYACLVAGKDMRK